MKRIYTNIQPTLFELQKETSTIWLKYFLTVCFSFFLFFNSVAQNALVPFTFKLTTASKTSAGVYKKDGTLIRTLWGGVSYPSGTHIKTWDRKDDEGHLITDTGLIVKVLSNNVNYKWEGVIGNTSDSTHGGSVIKSYYRMESMAIYGNYAYYATGYSEGSSGINKLDIKKPQNKISIMFANFGTSIAATYVATDGNYVYWAGFDPFGGQYKSSAQSAFTIATKVSNDAEVSFPNGTAVQCGAGRLYSKAIDVILNNSPKSNPTGLAVQKNGKYLFVAHGDLNIINVLNKTSGAAIRSISITNPRELCVDANDNLWIVSGANKVEKYAIDTATGNLSSTPLLTLSGIIEPIALAVSPNNYNVIVLDGSTSQQIKSYSNLSGNALWTYGKAGGYATDPTVTNDKFYFTDSIIGMKKEFIALQSDSSFWVSDGGNERVMHFSASRNFIDDIMYLHATYSVQVDRNNPTRAFNEFLEFKIDYSKPLAPNNGSWTLYKNWKLGIPGTHRNGTFNSNVFQNVVTLSNGKTYATLYNAVVPTRYPEVVELPASGNVRLTGIKFEAYSNELIDTDGTRRIFRTKNSTGDSGYWEIKQLTGFDTSNNPIWGNWTKIASIYVQDIKSPSYYTYSGGISFAEKTGSNMLITFNNALNEGYHLAGLKIGDNKYLWKTAASTFKESAPNAGDAYQGDFPTDGSYEISNGVHYGGGNVYTLEKNIFWGYHGEGWKGGQTNKWNHVYDNGLLISQFGITTKDAVLLDLEAPPELAGNVFSANVVKVGSDYYIYHNDEAVHSGMHRWKITGLNTIVEQALPISFSTTTGGLTGAYFNGTDLNNVNRKSAQVDSVVNLQTPPVQISNIANFSARWVGFIQPVYTQNYTFYVKISKGAKLWIDGKLVINQWNNATKTEYSSTAISMTAGNKYKVYMEINGGTAALLWSSSSQAKQIIPSKFLYPSDIPSYAEGIDLMEGLPSRSVLADGMYGWNRNSAQEDNTSGSQYWHVQTNLRSINLEKPDVLIRFRSDTKSSYVTRDLGKPISCLTSWTVSGNINYDGNEPNFGGTSHGGFFDILDSKGKIISRIINERTWNGSTNPSQIKCNGTSIVNVTANVLSMVTNKTQPFEINTDSTGIIFKYANFTPIKVNRFDTTSNWKEPTTIKFHFTSSNNFNYDKTLNIETLKFKAVATPLPQVGVSGATNFCQGDSVSLTSTPSNSYLWSNGLTSQSIKVKTTGNYVVKVKDSKGCVVPSDTIKVKVNTLPVANITASGATTFCQGDSVTITASNANSYLWSNNATTNKITIKDAGLASLIVKDAFGCASLPKAPVQITVNPLPTVPTITTDKATVFCMGDTITLTSSLANSYLWNSNATTQSIKAVISGDYSVKVGDANGCYNTSIIVPLKANIVPKTDITPSGSTTICQGELVTLTASHAVAYLWSNNETTQSIIVDAADDYMVVTKDANECFSTSPITSVNVNALPDIPKINVVGEILTSSALNGNQWYFNDEIIPGATARTYTATKNGKYIVKVSDGNNCNSTSDPYNCLTIGLNHLITHKIEIVPNPSTGIIEIKSQNINSGEISISNSLGAVIYTADYNGERIDMTNFAKGVYTVQILTSQQILKGKVITQ